MYGHVKQHHTTDYTQDGIRKGWKMMKGFLMRNSVKNLRTARFAVAAFVFLLSVFSVCAVVKGVKFEGKRIVRHDFGRTVDVVPDFSC